MARLGWLGKVFPTQAGQFQEVLEHAKRPGSDLIILMGGDHHLPFLHDTEAKRDAWRASRVPTLAICYESIIDTRFPGSQEKSRSALATFSHFAVCDEKDEAFYAEGGAPVTWMPQCVDPDTFRPGTGQRRPQVFFRGKSDLALHYRARAELLAALRGEPAFHHCEQEVGEEDLVRLYQDHAGTVNLPGVFGGYNVRTFEALASGCILLQNKVADRPRNQALLPPGSLLEYDPADVPAVVRLVREVAADPGAFADLARTGREACLEAHTIEHRLRQLLAFVEASWRSAPKLHIGCGDVVLPGFVNIDSRAEDPRVVEQEARTLPGLAPGGAVLAYACHILEHFPKDQTVEVLANWRARIKPGGRIYISVPDARFLAFQYLMGRRLERILPPLFGGQEYPGNFHFTAFDFRTLRASLLQAGWRNVRRFDPKALPFTRFDCSRWPLSLNVEAENPATSAAPEQPAPFRHRCATLIRNLARYGRGLRRLRKP